MEHKDFEKYRHLLQRRFKLYPNPSGPVGEVWYSKEFELSDDSPTHLTIRDLETRKTYALPLVLIEFISPGLIRLTREIKIADGMFV